MQFDFDILFIDSSRELADLAVEQIGNNPKVFAELYDYTMLQKKQFAMRSSRVVALLAEKYPTLINPYFEKIIFSLETLKDESVKRNFVWILRIYSWHDDENLLGKLIDTCFKFLLSEKEAIAVRAHSLAILHKIAKKEHGIIPELLSTIEFVSINASSGLAHCCNNVYKSLNK
ncbi:MAG: hypothetical protein A2033_18620 [Bacteroidetes bacterium GWA2_31_9]|nr:MAG: hypothetical protein A2033_18620 [Bacteroidetes bacterium GWA2_31_9]